MSAAGAAARGWMRRRVLTRAGKIIPYEYKSTPTSRHRQRNPFQHPFREDPPQAKIKDRIPHWNIAIGDKVKVIQGEHKGKEGMVTALDRQSNLLIVKDLEKRRRPVPEDYRLRGEPETIDVDYPVHYSNLRLIAWVPDPIDGKHKREVVLKKVHQGKVFFHRRKRRLTFHRYVPGTRYRIPWPRSNIEHEIHPDDTYAEVVRRVTFKPTLYHCPLPFGVEFELHNRYSDFKMAKFGLVKKQINEYIARRRPDIASKRRREQQRIRDKLIWTPQQAQIRKANKEVAKARKKLGKQQNLSKESQILIASNMIQHMEKTPPMKIDKALPMMYKPLNWENTTNVEHYLAVQNRQQRLQANNRAHAMEIKVNRPAKPKILRPKKNVQVKTDVQEDRKVPKWKLGLKKRKKKQKA